MDMVVEWGTAQHRRPLLDPLRRPLQLQLLHRPLRPHLDRRPLRRPRPADMAAGCKLQG